jgi:predicted metal-dependent peptidase
MDAEPEVEPSAAPEAEVDTKTKKELDATRLAAARLRAVDTQPFLAQAIFALTPIAAPTISTMAVDENWRLFINPAQLDEWSIPEIAGVLLHEVGHIVRDHSGRAREVRVDASTRNLWNLGADAEINDDLRNDGIDLPSGIYPENFGEPSGRVAEYYYARLLARAQPPEEEADCGAGCHSMAPSEEGDGDDDAPAAGTGADDDAPKGLSDIEASLIRRQVAEAVLSRVGMDADQSAGGWTRWAEALLRPTVDWRKELQASVRAALGYVQGARDYSYMRPARRRVSRVVLPALVRPLPCVAVVVDTSASISAEGLTAAWSEVHSCVRNLGVRRDLLTLFATDATATRLAGPTSRRVALQGGGGTDMRAGIAAAATGRPRPDIIVVITDGVTPWPEQPPRARVIVALLPVAGGGRPPLPTWARIVPLPL